VIAFTSADETVKAMIDRCDIFTSDVATERLKLLDPANHAVLPR
jgi:hypothetical protein